MEPQRSWTLGAKPQGLTVREWRNSPVLFALQTKCPQKIKTWKIKIAF